jgi:hypothetical protein
VVDQPVELMCGCLGRTRCKLVRCEATFGAYWTFMQTITLEIDRFGFPITDEERGDVFY